MHENSKIFTFHLTAQKVWGSIRRAHGQREHTGIWANGKQCRINWSKWKGSLKNVKQFSEWRNHVIESHNPDQRWAVGLPLDCWSLGFGDWASTLDFGGWAFASRRPLRSHWLRSAKILRIDMAEYRGHLIGRTVCCWTIVFTGHHRRRALAEYHSPTLRLSKWSH